MSTQKRLFLLDAYALIFRGYYALIKNPRINSKGMDTSAILGFTNSLLDVIKREKPNHLAVAFDKGGSHIRSEAFPEYKSNRQETPEAIKIAVPYIHKILEAMHIPIIEKEGFEADDLIGTLSKQAEKEGFQTFMVTPDKDFAQLVSENIFMYKPSRMGNGIEIWGIPEVQKKFEVERPEQVIDYLGMMGDAVDNIPGLPGVGDKTAKKFLKTYGSMENLLANTHELKGKMREKVEANKELGLLSKQLATILLDCPVQFHEKDFELNHPDFNKTAEIFKELEFRRIAESLPKIFESFPSHKNQTQQQKESSSTEKSQTSATSHQFDLFSTIDIEDSSENNLNYKTTENSNHFYQFVDTPFSRKLLLKKLITQKSVSFHIETIGANSFEADIIGVSFSYEKGKGYFVNLSGDKENTKEILEEFRPFFENKTIEKIGHNIKYSIKVLYNYAIKLKGNLFDTMLAHYLLNPDMRHNLDVLSETYLNYKPTSLESLIGKKGKNQLSIRKIELKKQANFTVEKADLTFQLKQFFEKDIAKLNLKKLYVNIEIPLLRVLASMELEGIRLDADFLNSLSEKLIEDIQNLENTIYKEANIEFNLASPKQLGDVLFEHLKLVEKPKKTKTGQYATGEEILSKLAPKHKIVKEILEWRGLVKLKNTYVDALPNDVNKKTGRIHTTFSQAVASTGRLSSNNPNLQNIPIRTERGRQVRKAFVPRNENYTLVSADYSQIELRIIASLSNDKSMIESFNRGEDIHASTAAKIYGIPLNEVTREQRSDAKAVNFGIIYGQGAFTLAQQLNKSRAEAKELIDSYYKTFPTLKQYIANQIDFARENEYVETISGRRRYLKNINSQNAIVRSGDERNAVNAPIQGSAADIIKIAMIKIDTLLKEGNYKSKMLLQVHDELVFDMHNDEIATLKPLIIKEMEHAFEFSVPLTVDLGEGQNWLEAH
ncbi:DNA polymerase I [Lutibacter profundi]|uniref:DNA polymerase I n=1 Tax=Lutibacter profundi TaxID=1622118 RepID=A0A109RP24_9FLAO|nr:DNA polymerase I [Lutibacter profundi]AMC11650.1 DNA polymerase I [Lutibacter profundi]